MGSGKIDVNPLITHRIALDDWENGFNLMETQQAIKVLFTELE
jgi:threonine dehydrogenase-like Zn-dependent dehydrogenase